MGSSARNHPVFVLGWLFYGFVSTKMRSFCSKVAVLWVSQHKNAPFCSKVAVLWVRQHKITPFLF